MKTLTTCFAAALLSVLSMSASAGLMTNELPGTVWIKGLKEYGVGFVQSSDGATSFNEAFSEYPHKTDFDSADLTWDAVQEIAAWIPALFDTSPANDSPKFRLAFNVTDTDYEYIWGTASGPISGGTALRDADTEASFITFNVPEPAPIALLGLGLLGLGLQRRRQRA